MAIMSIVLSACQNQTHEQIIAQANSDLKNIEATIEVVSNSVKVIAPIAGQVAQDAGANQSLVDGIKEAAKVSASVSEKLNALAAVSVAVPANTPVLDTSSSSTK